MLRAGARESEYRYPSRGSISESGMHLEVATAERAGRGECGRLGFPLTRIPVDSDSRCLLRGAGPARRAAAPAEAAADAADRLAGTRVTSIAIASSGKALEGD